MEIDAEVKEVGIRETERLEGDCTVLDIQLCILVGREFGSIFMLTLGSYEVGDYTHAI